ncbi:MAG TPA: ETEC_3214 domain-containing protein, partial [Mycobacterium sp.]
MEQQVNPVGNRCSRRSNATPATRGGVDERRRQLVGCGVAGSGYRSVCRSSHWRLVGTLAVARRWWDRSFGRRHAQARILDQLSCSVSMVFIESQLGVPLFITHPYGDEREERIYRLSGAWVAIQPKHGAVHLFSITITDPKMYYDISDMTRGVLKLKLGKDTFAHVNPEYHDSESLWFGTRQAGYLRHYFLGNSSGYLHYWLSFNAVGAGVFPSDEQPYQSGMYGKRGDRPPNSTTITANTFTALD